MKSLLCLTAWMLAVAVTVFDLVLGLTGIVFLRSLGDAGICAVIAMLSCVMCAIAFERISALAPDIGIDVMTDVYRVRNWWRRRTWRAFAAALAGQSTAASFGRGAYR